MNDKIFNYETINRIKRILNNSKIIFEIYVNGKIYIERRDYRKLEQGEVNLECSADILKLTTPVYGALQLLDLFNKNIEKIRIFSSTYVTMNSIEREITKLANLRTNRDSNVLEIYF